MILTSSKRTFYFVSERSIPRLFEIQQKIEIFKLGFIHLEGCHIPMLPLLLSCSVSLQSSNPKPGEFI